MAYCVPIESVIPASITVNGFADDHSIRKSFIAKSRDQEHQTISMLMGTVTTIASWMDSMHLKLNLDKTDFIMFGYRSQLVKCTTDSVGISDSAIPRIPSDKYLGVTLDENLSLKDYIILKCREAMANFLMIFNICKFLTKDVCTTLVLDLWISHHDYANALFCGLLEKPISHLQKIHAMCAKLTLDKSKFDSTTEVLAHLHWLAVRQRIKFKITTITHKCIFSMAPQYLKDLHAFTLTPRNLRSSTDTTRLIVPFTKCKTFAV